MQYLEDSAFCALLDDNIYPKVKSNGNVEDVAFVIQGCSYASSAQISFKSAPKSSHLHSTCSLSMTVFGFEGFSCIFLA